MDSKQLTEAKRDSLWEALQTSGFIGWQIRVLHAKEISEGMLRIAQEAYQVLAATRRPGGCILKEDTLKYKIHFVWTKFWVHLYTFASSG